MGKKDTFADAMVAARKVIRRRSAGRNRGTSPPRRRKASQAAKAAKMANKEIVEAQLRWRKSRSRNRHKIRSCS